MLSIYLQEFDHARKFLYQSYFQRCKIRVQLITRTKCYMRYGADHALHASVIFLFARNATSIGQTDIDNIKSLFRI